MTRGREAQVGDTMTNALGYNQTRTAKGWVPTHHLIAWAALGREHKPDLEMVKFKDGDRTNLKPENIHIVPRRTTSANARLAGMISQRADLDMKIKDLQKELGLDE